MRPAGATLIDRVSRRGNGIGSIRQIAATTVPRTVRTTVESAIGLETVPHDAAIAMLARRGQRMDRAFETVEGMGTSTLYDLEGLVVVVTADFADGHGSSSF
jgi:hypothetical protein